MEEKKELLEQKERIKSEDLELIVTCRSSVESQKLLNSLLDLIIKSVTSEFQVCLVEKEVKILIRKPKGLTSIRMILQNY